MGVFAEQIAEFGQADTAGPCQRRRIGKIVRRRVHPRDQALEKRDVLIFAPVEKVGAAALARAQTERLRFVFRL